MSEYEDMERKEVADEAVKNMAKQIPQMMVQICGNAMAATIAHLQEEIENSPDIEEMDRELIEVQFESLKEFSSMVLNGIRNSEVKVATSQEEMEFYQSMLGPACNKPEKPDDEPK